MESINGWLEYININEERHPFVSPLLSREEPSAQEALSNTFKAQTTSC